MRYTSKSQISVNTSVKGIGFCGLLTIALIVLKLVGVIECSWIWVVAPLWVPVALIILGFIMIMVFASIVNK